MARAFMHHMQAGFAFRDRDFARASDAAALAEALWDEPAMRDARDSMIVMRAAARAEREWLERALPLVRSAREIAPWHTSFAITEACVLAASSDAANQHVNEARALLKSLEREKLDRQNAAYAALARGLCAASEGDLEAATSLRDASKSLGATAAPLRVLERRFPSP